MKVLIQRAFFARDLRFCSGPFLVSQSVCEGIERSNLTSPELGCTFRATFYSPLPFAVGEVAPLARVRGSFYGRGGRRAQPPVGEGAGPHRKTWPLAFCVIQSERRIPVPVLGPALYRKNFDNAARPSSPLPIRERIEGEGPYQRPARFRILRLALVSCPTNTFEMVQFVPEQPPTALSSLSSASVPLSRRKGVGE